MTCIWRWLFKLVSSVVLIPSVTGGKVVSGISSGRPIKSDFISFSINIVFRSVLADSILILVEVKSPTVVV